MMNVSVVLGDSNVQQEECQEGGAFRHSGDAANSTSVRVACCCCRTSLASSNPLGEALASERELESLLPAPGVRSLSSVVFVVVESLQTAKCLPDALAANLQKGRAGFV
jgi:hypothetical protein